ncbi:MAG: primosomal protein N' [Oscillatoriaceae bacterium SKW80]|nr:primosomal protein N' [Oscillatoriaceae bacterium SKYG93]MCX8119725.1 primosomal protein N' [Oscillatoriaceae bacterium SKW80]MDW8452398.1 primosomal protein N' [Oscillatoriaceae cyanobacterium SKYGB_i_bin93]HIK27629.1 primosomal protein N' [Oscillatoriaceae cyanobacterium M7585_C2015_266]
MYKQDFETTVGIVAEPGADYKPSPKSERWIEVLVECPTAQKKDSQGEENLSEEEEKESSEEEKLYIYRVPPDLKVEVGDIVSVPFSSQLKHGIVIRFAEQLPANLPPEKVREVEDVLIALSSLPKSYRQLLACVATYYCTPLIQVIKTALPPGSLGQSKRRIRLKKEAIPLGANVFLPNDAARRILKLLEASKTGDLSWQQVQRQVKGAEWGLQKLRERGWVETYQEPFKQPRAKRQLALILVNDIIEAEEISARQQEVLRTVLILLKRNNGAVWLKDAISTCGTTVKTLEALTKTGCFVIEEREILRLPTPVDIAPDNPKDLTKYQKHALDIINNLSGFSQVLLHGVTGSGKTEVYLQAIAPILKRNQSALVLVPEIGLTPQLAERFTARFGKQVCLYHSALSPGERYDTWRQMLQGTPQVVIGTRSAIFAPLPNLGLIILDEEYDESYKQTQLAPTYHARTVARWRAELVNCPLILGSATPSLETWVEIAQKTKPSQSPNPPIPASPSCYLSLPERIQSRPLPPIEIVDMREELRANNRSIFSRSLKHALERMHQQGNQGILFIHRRGYSSFVCCRSCGYVMECPNCDISLSHHRTSNGMEILRCHYCNHFQLKPEKCPKCTSPYLKNFGSGSQRVEEELRKEFPYLRAIRFDSDTTRTKGAHQNLLKRFANKEADLLIGTQMLTKGLDLPQVTLVGVVAADGLLNLPDYRARERGFQILTQVAGRAGRGNDPGHVIIQTYMPEHPVITAVQRYEYGLFVEAELQERLQLNYPPYGRLILLRLSGTDAGEVEKSAERIANRLSPIDSIEEPVFELLGPAPAPIMRIDNKYRWQILLKFPPNVPVELPSLTELRSLCFKNVSLTIDVEPLNFG